MVEQDHGTRRSPPSRVVLSAAGWAAEVTPGSTGRFVGGEPQAWRDEPAPGDSLYRCDSGRSADRADPDSAPVSHQKATVGVQRLGSGDAQQWGIPLRARTTAQIQEAHGAT